MTNRIAALTGVRAFAALLVCLSHSAFATGDYQPDLLGRVFARIEVGVPIFFVLSGLLLFRPWVAALAEPGAAGTSRTRRADEPSILTYFYHRVRRVVPAYWIVIVAVYAIYLVKPLPNPSGDTWSAFLRHLGFLQIYGRDEGRDQSYLHSGLTHLWSMCVEVVFYLAIPVIAIVLCRWICGNVWRPGRILVGLGVVMAVTPIWFAWINTDPARVDIDATWRITPPSYVWWLGAGMALAVLIRMGLRVNPWMGLLVCVVSFGVTLTSSAGPVGLAPSSLSEDLLRNGMYVIFATSLVALLAVPTGANPIGALFGARPLVWFGDISYEFFLVHMMVLDIVHDDLLGLGPFQGSLPTVFALTTALSIPIAWALHRVTTFDLERRLASERRGTHV